MINKLKDSALREGLRESSLLSGEDVSEEDEGNDVPEDSSETDQNVMGESSKDVDLKTVAVEKKVGPLDQYDFVE